MTRSVVFVHGTGVRANAFTATFREVKTRFEHHVQDVTVRPCFWGGLHGAKLALNGASIPDYVRSRGGSNWTYEEEQDALRAVLFVDPWYELRELGLGSEVVDGPGALTFQQEIQAYRPNETVLSALREHHVEEHFRSAIAALSIAPELVQASRTAVFDGISHRGAVARALLAFAVDAAVAEGHPSLDGTSYNTLFSKINEDLHGQHRGGAASQRVAAAVRGYPLHLLTRAAERRRGQLSDRATPAAGDILLYQSRGEGIRGLIRTVVDQAPGESITLVGHSLGGIACVDLLALEPVHRVDQLITVGSQAPFLYEIDALRSLRVGEPLPVHFPKRWLNAYDTRDLLSHPATPVFGDDRVQDLRVDNGQFFPQSHSAYWTNEAFWTSVASWLK